ncbi:hypothetical protein MMC07_005989 [Pseudocyphellaria aurata]|nr:hypothetical protein [Pseudocyphellaria aurata]
MFSMKCFKFFALLPIAFPLRTKARPSAEIDWNGRIDQPHTADFSDDVFDLGRPEDRVALSSDISPVLNTDTTVSKIQGAPASDIDFAAIVQNNQPDGSEGHEDIYDGLETASATPETAPTVPGVQSDQESSNRASCNSIDVGQQAEDKGTNDICFPSKTTEQQNQQQNRARYVEPNWEHQPDPEYGRPNPRIPGYGGEDPKQCSNKKWTLFCTGDRVFTRGTMNVAPCQVCRFSPCGKPSVK